ncbi:MAG: nitroreductase family protein [Thermoleophilia bacterium]|nr:nitroreductase family protein [Thermoleophilia bacterium]
MNSSEQYDCLLDLVTRRRTIRQFKPDPVPDEYITKIIEVARWAPSGFHTQPWEFVVVKDLEVKAKIVAALDEHGPAIKDPAKKDVPRASFRDAPVFILALIDWRAKVGLPYNPRTNEEAAPLYQSSMANAFVYMHLAATSLGLASQWYTATSRPSAERAIREVVGIPEALTIYDMMVVGYPAASPGPKIVRDLADMVHYDACGEQDFRTDEEVEEYARLTRAWCMGEH